MTDNKKQYTRDRIGLRTASLHKLKEWSQEELARRAGLQRTHISRIETGKYAVTLETIQAIAEALGMTVDIVDERLRDLAPIRVLTTTADER
jgi:transcriptional regulator with XRE-family HTH domain